MKLPWTRTAAIAIALTFLLYGVGLTTAEVGTPEVNDACAGAEEYVEAARSAIDDSIRESAQLFEDEGALLSATSDELMTAAAELADAKEAIEELDPPPAGAAYHAAVFEGLGLLSQMLTSMASGGLFAALPYQESVEANTAAREAAAADFEAACGVDVTDADEEGGVDSTPEPGVEASATPELGTRANPFPIGSEVELSDGWVISVISVEPDATEQVLAENQFNDPPAQGRQFFIARIRATYTGADSARFDGSYRLRAVGQSAVSYSTFDDSCGTIPDRLPDPEVFIGGTIEGNICWAIRSSDADSLVMYDDPFLGPDDDRVFLSLMPSDEAATSVPDRNSG